MAISIINDKAILSITNLLKKMRKLNPNATDEELLKALSEVNNATIH